MSVKQIKSQSRSPWHGAEHAMEWSDERMKNGAEHSSILSGVTGSVIQISISKGGIPKRPIEQARVGRIGIEGDRHAHPEFHGGPRKALLFIAQEGIEEIAALGFPAG